MNANWRKNYFLGHEDVVLEELLDTCRAIPGVNLDARVVMPNHVHCIIVLSNSALPLGEIIRRFKAKVSHRMRLRAWQPNYYERIIRNERELFAIRQYIVNNPMKKQ